MNPSRQDTLTRIERARELLASRPELRSKRRLEAALISEFNTGLRDKTLRELVREAARQAIARPHPTGITNPRNDRERAYNMLVAAHFLPGERSQHREGKINKGSSSNPPEAWEFAKIPAYIVDDNGIRHENNALLAMIRERQEMWDRFAPKTIRMTVAQREVAWRAYVRRWYRNQGLLTKTYLALTKTGKKRRIPSAWDLYERTKKELPPDESWDTPRLGQRGQQPLVSLNKATISQQINNLTRDYINNYSLPASTREKARADRDALYQMLRMAK